MEYYLSVCSWNLLESFVTESISPYSFYKKRNFGNSLSRYIDKSNDKINQLVLLSEDAGGAYSIKIDEQLLDKSVLLPVKRSKGLFTYNRTIYFNPGFTAFRFQNEDLKNAFITESQILFEVKCIDKYIHDFYVSDVKQKKTRSEANNKGISISFDEQNYVDQDNRYNTIKGAIVGFARGQMTSNSADEQQLLSEIIKLKNSFAGLNTEIMMGNSEITNSSRYISDIQQCKDLYNKQNTERTNLFDILLQQFNEIIKLTKERANELNDPNNDPEKWREKRAELHQQLDCMEGHLHEMRMELTAIKEAEKKNGIAIGQTRKYFKKGTPERERKEFLILQIEQYEVEHPEYAEIKRHIEELDENITCCRPGRTKYDTTLSALFSRVSDILNDLVKKTNNSLTMNDIDLTSIVVESDSSITVTSIDKYAAETEYLNIVINHMLQTPFCELISDMRILQIIEDTARRYQQTTVSQSTEGQQIVQSLREFWLYKQQRSASFSIPENLPVFQSVMAFFVKPFGFDQMERFMLNKRYSMKAYGFMLWGAYKGFAALPKTFTNVLYNEREMTQKVDDYLRTVLLHSAS
jgi:hypothetical protein